MRLWCVVATKIDGLCANRDFLSAALVACLDMSLLCAEVRPTLVSKEPIFANVAAFHLDRRSKAIHVQASAPRLNDQVVLVLCVKKWTVEASLRLMHADVDVGADCMVFG